MPTLPSPRFVVGARIVLQHRLAAKITTGHGRLDSHGRYLLVTREFVIACTESAMRFCTPTLRISLATCALTVRSAMPRGAPISLFDRPATSLSRPSSSPPLKITRPPPTIRPPDFLPRSTQQHY